MSTHPPTGAARRPPPGVADYALLLGLAVVWGASFVLIKIGVATIPPMTLTAVRLAIAAVLLASIAWAMGDRLPRSLRLWGLLALVSVTGNVIPYVMIAWGQMRIDSGVSAILMAVMPLLTVLVAHFMTTDEPMTGARIAGVVLGMAGLVTLIGPDRLAHLGEETLSELAVAGAASFYALNAVLTKRLTGVNQRAMAAAVMGIAAVVMVPAALIADRPLSLEPSTSSILAVLVLGLVQTGIGSLFLFELIRRQGASFFALINFLVPISGIAWGAAVLSERLPPNALVALVVILLGIAVARGSLGVLRKSHG